MVTRERVMNSVDLMLGMNSVDLMLGMNSVDLMLWHE